MPSVHEYINEIDRWRDTLADELTKMKVPASREEKLNTLVPKVLNIGGLSAKPIKAICLTGSIGIIGHLTEEE